MKNNTVVAQIPIKNVDLRDIEANETKTFSLNFDVPESISGDVDIALWLPDEKSVNQSNSRFSIRLANKNTWHSTHGHNILATKVGITLIAAKPKPPTVKPISKL
jgi:hypothetical protein